MKVFDFIILLMLIGVLGFSVYVLFQYLPTGDTQVKEYDADFSGQISGRDQFYPNMRYRDRVISFDIDGSCSGQKKVDVRNAFGIISSKSILQFNEVEGGEISILCSNLSPKPEEEGHFIAGEGGPSEIINASFYSVILSGKVSLYRIEKCENPNVAIHEILHALGFDHNNNKDSIMYPVTDCDQEIDQYIINDIDELYKVDSLPDLLVSKVSANKTGRYLNFAISVGNYGLKNSLSSNLVVFANQEEIKKIDLGNIDIGTRKVLSVENLRVPREVSSVRFDIETDEEELSKLNNVVEMSLE